MRKLGQLPRSRHVSPQLRNSGVLGSDREQSSSILWRLSIRNSEEEISAPRKHLLSSLSLYVSIPWIVEAHILRLGSKMM